MKNCYENDSLRTQTYFQVLLRKLYFFNKQMDFPKIKYTNAKHFNLVYVHEPKFGVLDFIFGIARFEVFLA